MKPSKEAMIKAAYDGADLLLRNMGLTLSCYLGMCYLRIMIAERCLGKMPSCPQQSMVAWLVEKEQTTANLIHTNLYYAFNVILKWQTITTAAVMGKHPQESDLTLCNFINRCAIWLRTYERCRGKDAQGNETIHEVWRATRPGIPEIVDPLQQGSPLEYDIAAESQLRHLLDLSSADLRRERKAKPELAQTISALLEERPRFQPPPDFYTLYLNQPTLWGALSLGDKVEIHKVYLTVRAEIQPDGYMIPLHVELPDGRRFDVDDPIDTGRRASYLGGPVTRRYKFKLWGRIRFLFLEVQTSRWFVEAPGPAPASGRLIG